MTLPEPGEMLAGKYKVHELLGEGGFARVFRATQIDIGRIVAIKVLRPRGGDVGVVSARFLREARVLSRLRDPHTVTLYDFGRTDDDLLYMVFEYVEGWTLSELLRERGALRAADARHVIDQLLHSLREAHDAGILHRDIKPANIMLHTVRDDPYATKLVDFGIAKSYSNPNALNVTAEGSVIGTPAYMSPEQLSGEELAPSSDLYSLGLVAYEMLTGNAAYDFESQKQLMKAQFSDESATLPNDVQVSSSTREMVDSCLRKDPGERPASAQEALDILAAAEDGATTVDERSAKPATAARVTLARALVLALAIGAVIAVGSVALLVDSPFVGRLLVLSRDGAPDPGLRTPDAGVALTIDAASDGVAVQPDHGSDTVDLVLVQGESRFLPYDDVRKVQVDEVGVVTADDQSGWVMLAGKNPGTTEVRIVRESETVAMIVEVVLATDERADDDLEPLTLFEGSRLEFEKRTLKRISIGYTGIVAASVSDDGETLTLTAKSVGRTAVSMLTAEGDHKTYMVTVVPIPEVLNPRDVGVDSAK